MLKNKNKNKNKNKKKLKISTKKRRKGLQKKLSKRNQKMTNSKCQEESHNFNLYPIPNNSINL